MSKLSWFSTRYTIHKRWLADWTQPSQCSRYSAFKLGYSKSTIKPELWQSYLPTWIHCCWDLDWAKTSEELFRYFINSWCMHCIWSSASRYWITNFEYEWKVDLLINCISFTYMAIILISLTFLSLHFNQKIYRIRNTLYLANQILWLWSHDQTLVIKTMDSFEQHFLYSDAQRAIIKDNSHFFRAAPFEFLVTY